MCRGSIGALLHPRSLVEVACWGKEGGDGGGGGVGKRDKVVR